IIMIDSGRTRMTMRHVYVVSVAIIAALFVGVSSITVSPELTREIILTTIILSTVSLALEMGITFPLLISGATSFSTVTYVAMIFMLPFPIPAIAGAAMMLL